MSATFKKGSTRERIFKVLLSLDTTSPNYGYSREEIRIKCGIPERSGTLGMFLAAEVRLGRIKEGRREGDLKQRSLKVYTLSSAGKKAFKDGTISFRANRGHPIGYKVDRS